MTTFSKSFSGKAHLLLAAAPLALCFGGTAWAQGAPTSTTPQAAADETVDPGEIIVTARYREEKLQDVPLAITSLSTQALENANVRNLRDIAYLTPGLTITSGGSEFGVSPVIRGQTNLNGGQGDPNVTVFIDGVYIVNNTAINLGMVDIERVEIVKGPVSALYGRNAFAGAINYISKQPDLNTPHGRITAFGGNDQQYSLSGMVSYPLIPGVLAASVAGGYEHFGGSYKDKVNGERAGGFEKKDGQVSILFTPDDRFRVAASYYYGKDTFGPSAIAYNNNNCGFRNVPASNQDPSGTGFTQFCGGFDDDDHPVEVPVISNLTGAAGNDRKVQLGRFKASYDFGVATLSSLTGYTKIDQQRFTDFIGRRNGAPYRLVPGPGLVNLLEFFGSNTNTEDFSEELRLQSPGDKPFRWQLGGFYYKGRNQSRTILSLDGTPIPAGQQLVAGFARNSVTFNGVVSDILKGETLQHDTQYSGFVGLEYDLTDALTISGEYRRTHQKKDILVIRNTGCPGNLTAPTATCNGSAATPFLFPNGPTPVAGTFNFDNYRGTVKYQVAPSSNIYASVATGTKAGGFNQRSVAAPDGTFPDRQFDPETNHTYEVGIKNSFLNNRVLVNVAAFHIETKGIQISGPSAVASNPGLVTKNFGSVKTDGFEVEIAAKVATGVKVNMGVGYADPRFGKDAFDFFAAGACASSNLTTGVITPVLPQCAKDVVILPPNSKYNNSNFPKAALSLNNNHVPRQSQLQLTGGLDLDGDLGASGWRWTANGNVRWEDKQYGFNNNISWYGPRTIVNLKIGVENETFSIAGYVNNLTNDHTPEIISVNARLSDFGGDIDGYLPVGRQYGVTATAKF
jgi:iron complex outermembrane receptor protein